MVVVAREEDGKLAFNMCGVSLLVLETDRSDGGTTVWMYRIPQNSTPIHGVE
jgi:hypothetical protein